MATVSIVVLLDHITPSVPPPLIYHGDGDTLTPLEQSEWFRDRAAEQGCEMKSVVHPGGKHGWPTMIWEHGSAPTGRPASAI